MIKVKTMNGLRIFSGTANVAFAQKICDYLEIEMGKSRIERFSDGEIKVSFDESVRGKEAYIIQPTCPPVSEHILELLIMIDALKRASASKITAVLPYYAYACQEKKDTPREPISAKLIADCLETAGVTRIITMDLHAGAIQGFFDVPVDHLTAIPIISKYFMNKNIQNPVLVAADDGRAKHVRRVAGRVGAPLAVSYKYHPEAMVSSITHLAGDVKGKTPIIVEDMIRTGGTIIECVKALLDNGANPEIYIAATHGIFSGDAFKKLSAMPEIKEVIITDTIPLPDNAPSKFKVLSVTDMFAESIRRIHHNESITSLYM